MPWSTYFFSQAINPINVPEHFHVWMGTGIEVPVRLKGYLRPTWDAFMWSERSHHKFPWRAYLNLFILRHQCFSGDLLTILILFSLSSIQSISPLSSSSVEVYASGIDKSISDITTIYWTVRFPLTHGIAMCEVAQDGNVLEYSCMCEYQKNMWLSW